jgi:hypothetical protein
MPAAHVADKPVGNGMKLRLLRMVLGFAACVWGVSIFGVFLSWSAASEALQELGAKPLAYDPMLDYWLRMAAGAFSLIGGLFLVLMIWPRKYAVVILLVHGLRLELPPLPFYADSAACLAAGGAILLLAPHAKTQGVEPWSGLI